MVLHPNASHDPQPPYDAAKPIPVVFADYNIQNPSFAGFVTTQDHGILEFLLMLTKA